MQSSTPERTSPVAGVLVLVGGALAAIGCILGWFKVRADLTSIGGQVQTQTAKGLDTSDGKMFIWVAIAVALIGLVLLFLKGRGGRLALSALAFLGAAFVGGFGLYDALTPKAQAIEEASTGLNGIGVEQAKKFLEGLFDQGILKITVQIGLWMVVAGGVVALIGALVGLVSRPKAQVVTAEAPMGFDAAPSAAVAPSPGAWAQPEAPAPPPMPPPPSEPPPTEPPATGGQA